MRAAYPTLPSVAPLIDGSLETKRYTHGGWSPGAEPQDNPGCRDMPGAQNRGPTWTLEVPGQAPAVQLWATGDSITMGDGVEPPQSYSARVAVRIAEETGRAVALTNVGINGAGYCDSLRETHSLWDAGAPDVLLHQGFADDLEDRSIVLAEGQLVGFPERVQTPVLGALVQRSYTANLLWLHTVTRFSGPPERYVSPENRGRYLQAIQTLHSRAAQDGVGLVAFHLEPVGMALCDRLDPRPEECTWMRQDHRLMRDIVASAGLPAIDLEGLWPGDPPHTLPAEDAMYAQRTRLHVHPDPAGHQRLADALWPAVSAALTP